MSGGMEWGRGIRERVEGWRRCEWRMCSRGGGASRGLSEGEMDEVSGECRRYKCISRLSPRKELRLAFTIWSHTSKKLSKCSCSSSGDTAETKQTLHINSVILEVNSVHPQ